MSVMRSLNWLISDRELDSRDVFNVSWNEDFKPVTSVSMLETLPVRDLICSSQRAIRFLASSSLMGTEGAELAGTALLGGGIRLSFIPLRSLYVCHASWRRSGEGTSGVGSSPLGFLLRGPSTRGFWGLGVKILPAITLLSATSYFETG